MGCLERCLSLQCPECLHLTLDCQVMVSQGAVTVTLLSQTCECDPYGAWEDVWEQAREIVLEEGRVD